MKTVLLTLLLLAGCASVPVSPDEEPVEIGSGNDDRPLADRWPAPDAPCASDTEFCGLLVHPITAP